MILQKQQAMNLNGIIKENALLVLKLEIFLPLCKKIIMNYSKCFMNVQLAN